MPTPRRRRLTLQRRRLGNFAHRRRTWCGPEHRPGDAGLALLAASEADARSLAAEAAAAYRAARAITSAAGVTGRAVRLLDALAVADALGLLKPVRSTAAGEAAIAS